MSHQNQKTTSQNSKCNRCHNKGYYHPRQSPTDKEICDYCAYGLRYEDLQVAHIHGWGSKRHKQFQEEALQISKQYATQ